MESMSKGYITFKIFNGLFMALVVAACLFPFLYAVSVSLSSSSAVMSGSITIYPKGFHTDAYQIVFRDPNFLTGYKNTVVYTVVGTLLALFLTTIAAYPLSKKQLKGRSIFMKLIVFSMFFTGGLIPNFLVIRACGLMDTMWALIVPLALNQWYLVFMITYFQGIPDSLEESASIDGLNPIQILIRIMLPLSKPIIATITLFYAVGIWNEWFLALIYINTTNKIPVMLILRNIVVGQTLAMREGSYSGQTNVNTVAANVRCASVAVVAVPMLIIYPFLQKHFVKGVMIGSLKG